MGCMQNTKFNGEEVNIWSSAVLSGQSTHCCKQMEIKTPELEPGTRFDGFGYLVLSGAGTDMSQNPVMFSVQFRTSNPSATILKIAKSDESVVYMIYLNRGQVTIDIRINDLSRVRISSGNSYSNGKWVQVGYCLTSFYITVGINVWRERNVLFNDALNTFYLCLYGVRHMVKDHSDSDCCKSKRVAHVVAAFLSCYMYGLLP